MSIIQETLTTIPRRSGLHEITPKVQEITSRWLSFDAFGLVNLFVQHTSASLVVQENADPSARKDLEDWLGRLVREDDPNFTHTYEGPDDMPAHIKSTLTATSLSVPIWQGSLALGTWQGIFLWEHRDRPIKRTIFATIIYDSD